LGVRIFFSFSNSQVYVGMYCAGYFDVVRLDFCLNFQVYVGLYCAGYLDAVRSTLLINVINSVASLNNTAGILRRHFLFVTAVLFSG
jgi:hypothetical protein